MENVTQLIQTELTKIFDRLTEKELVGRLETLVEQKIRSKFLTLSRP